MLNDEITTVFGKPIHVYTRAQALADGVLIDVSKIACEAGLNIPIAVTDTIWNELIHWTDEDTQRQTYQDTNGRLWDVLYMLRCAIRKSHPVDCVFYELYVVPRDGKSKRAIRRQLKAIIDGGDNGVPVITLMLPNED